VSRVDITPADRLAVEDLLMAYTRFGDGGRFDDLVALFAPDATFQVGEAIHTGPAEIRAFFIDTGESFAAQSTLLPGGHHVSSRWFEAKAPDHVSSGSRFLYVGPQGPDHWGTYRDEVRQVDGSWRIASRRVRTLGFSEASSLRRLT
jgi:hypothetical protein